MKIEVNADDPFHVTIKDLLFDHECNAITNLLGPRLHFPPGKMDATSPKKNDWTMKKYVQIEK